MSWHPPNIRLWLGSHSSFRSIHLATYDSVYVNVSRHPKCVFLTSLLPLSGPRINDVIVLQGTTSELFFNFCLCFIPTFDHLSYVFFLTTLQNGLSPFMCYHCQSTESLIYKCTVEISCISKLLHRTSLLRVV